MAIVTRISCEMAAWRICTMLKFRPFCTFFRTPVLFKKEDDERVKGVLLKLNRPKRPPVAFIRFLMKRKKELEEKYPEKSNTEIIKIASKLWKDTSEKEKSQFNLEYAMDMEEYMTQKNNFKKDVESYKHKDEWIKGSKKITEEDKILMGKPYQPKLSFMAFCSYVKDSFPGVNRQELLVKAGEKWRSNDDKDKKKFIEKFSKVAEKSQQDLIEWEESMYKKGYLELVRPSSLKKFRKLE